MLNATDFASVQDAVNALPTGGGTVYVSRGVWTDTAVPRYAAVGSSTLSLPSDRPVRVVGDGPDSTIFRSSNSSQPIVTVPGDGSALERPSIESTAPLPGSGTPSRGIVVAPALSSWLETNGRVRVPQASGTGALTDVANGDIVYNTSTNKLNIRVNGAWAGVSTTTP